MVDKEPMSLYATSKSLVISLFYLHYLNGLVLYVLYFTFFLVL